MDEIRNVSGPVVWAEIAGEDVTAYLRDTLDLAPGEVLTAAKVADMWRRGYEQAITHLRDKVGYRAWWNRQSATAEPHLSSFYRNAAADYLSARLTEETTHGD